MEAKFHLLCRLSTPEDFKGKMALVEDTEAEDFKPMCILVIMEEVVPLAQDFQITGVAAVAVTDTTALVAAVDICRGIPLEGMLMVVSTAAIIIVSFGRHTAVRRICRANCKPWRIVAVAVPGQASVLG